MTIYQKLKNWRKDFTDLTFKVKRDKAAGRWEITYSFVWEVIKMRGKTTVSDEVFRFCKKDLIVIYFKDTLLKAVTDSIDDIDISRANVFRSNKG